MPNSEAKVAANNRYSAKTYENISFRAKRDGSDGFTRDAIVEAAKASGKSVNQFILEAIREKLDK